MLPTSKRGAQRVISIMKISKIGIPARDALLAGANYVADAVKTTQGPYGQNFLLEKGNRVTNDGITIARELVGSIEDDIERRGALAVFDAMDKANNEAGDGSTGTATLFQAIIKECEAFWPKEGQFASKRSPVSIKKQIDEEHKLVLEKLTELATPITTEQQLIEVATVSVEDTELGELIGKAQWELGPQGFILPEETNDPTCSIDRITGIRIDNGFGTTAVVNRPDKEALEVVDVRVIYTNHTIQNLEPVKHIIEALIAEGEKEIVIVGRAFSENAIQACLANQKQGMNIYPLNAAYTDQVEVMKDLQAVLGGTFIDIEKAELRNMTIKDVGYAHTIEAKRWSTVFAGFDTPEARLRIAERIGTLEKKFEGSPSDFEKNNLTARIAQLKNGFALLKVGANTELERKYKKDKVDDAVNAVRSAFQEGVVPGAGLALKTIAEGMDEDSILKNAIQAPYKQIQLNAGGNLEIPEWVKDPVKVVRISLEKACSVASVFVTAGGAIATKTEKPNCHAVPTSQD